MVHDVPKARFVPGAALARGLPHGPEPASDLVAVIVSLRPVETPRIVQMLWQWSSPFMPEAMEAAANSPSTLKTDMGTGLRQTGRAVSR